MVVVVPLVKEDPTTVDHKETPVSMNQRYFSKFSYIHSIQPILFQMACPSIGPNCFGQVRVSYGVGFKSFWSGSN